MKYCSNCGQQIKAGAKFCPFCGAQQVSANQSPAANNQDSVNSAVSAQAQQTPVSSQSQQTIQSAQPQQQNQQGQYQQQQPNGQGQPGFINNMSQGFQNFQHQYQGDANNQQPLDFIGSCKYSLAHWNDFKTPEGRKSVFWWTVVGATLASLVILIPYYIIASLIPALAMVLMIVFGLGITVLEFSATGRRLVYLDKSPWLSLLYLVPLVSLYLIYLMVIDKPQPNYGYQQPPYQNQGMAQNNQQPNSATSMATPPAKSSQNNQ